MALLTVCLAFLLCFASSVSLNNPTITGATEVAKKQLPSKALIQKMCNGTIFNKLCVSSVQADPRSRDSSLNSRDILGIVIDRAIAKRSMTSSYITLLLLDCKDEVTKWRLKMCYELYEQGIAYLDEALKLIYREDCYGDLYIRLSMFFQGPGDCEEGFKELPVRKSPLTSKNMYMGNISNLAMEITNLIYCNRSLPCE